MNSNNVKNTKIQLLFYQKKNKNICPNNYKIHQE